MRFGIDYSFEVECRRLKVRVRPLSSLEIVQTTTAAGEAYQKLPEGQRISITASLLLAMHQLEAASKPDIGDQATLPMSVMQLMTPDEVNHLWKQYVRVCDRVNPSLEEMPADEFNRLVEDLKKSSDQVSILTDLSISGLIQVCRHLLAQPPASPPAS
jgi:hypothetical protein